MKTLTMHFVIAAAALAAVATGASAQTYKADIPMAFRAGSTLLPAGSYDFAMVDGSAARQVLRVRSRDGNEAVILLSSFRSDAPKAWRASSKPKVAFACAAHNCSLVELYDPREIYAYNFPAAKLPASEADRASIIVNLTRAD